MANTLTQASNSKLLLHPQSRNLGATLRESREIVLLGLPALTLVVALFIFPFLYGFDQSLHADPSGTGDRSLANYIAFFSDPSQIESIGQTFQVALPTTIFSVALSIPLAY